MSLELERRDFLKVVTAGAGTWCALGDTFFLPKVLAEEIQLTPKQIERNALIELMREVLKGNPQFWRSNSTRNQVRQLTPLIERYIDLLGDPAAPDYERIPAKELADTTHFAQTNLNFTRFVNDVPWDNKPLSLHYVKKIVELYDQCLYHAGFSSTDQQEHKGALSSAFFSVWNESKYNGSYSEAEIQSYSAQILTKRFFSDAQTYCSHQQLYLEMLNEAAGGSTVHVFHRLNSIKEGLLLFLTDHFSKTILTPDLSAEKLTSEVNLVLNLWSLSVAAKNSVHIPLRDSGQFGSWLYSSLSPVCSDVLQRSMQIANERLKEIPSEAWAKQGGKLSGASSLVEAFEQSVNKLNEKGFFKNEIQEQLAQETSSLSDQLINTLESSSRSFHDQFNSQPERVDKNDPVLRMGKTQLELGQLLSCVKEYHSVFSRCFSSLTLSERQIEEVGRIWMTQLAPSIVTAIASKTKILAEDINSLSFVRPDKETAQLIYAIQHSVHNLADLGELLSSINHPQRLELADKFKAVTRDFNHFFIKNWGNISEFALTQLQGSTTEFDTRQYIREASLTFSEALQSLTSEEMQVAFHDLLERQSKLVESDPRSGGQLLLSISLIKWGATGHSQYSTQINDLVISTLRDSRVDKSEFIRNGVVPIMASRLTHHGIERQSHLTCPVSSQTVGQLRRYTDDIWITCFTGDLAILMENEKFYQLDPLMGHFCNIAVGVGGQTTSESREPQSYSDIDLELESQADDQVTAIEVLTTFFHDSWQIVGRLEMAEQNNCLHSSDIPAYPESWMQPDLKLSFDISNQTLDAWKRLASVSTPLAQKLLGHIKEKSAPTAQISPPLNALKAIIQLALVENFERGEQIIKRAESVGSLGINVTSIFSELESNVLDILTTTHLDQFPDTVSSKSDCEKLEILKAEATSFSEIQGDLLHLRIASAVYTNALKVTSFDINNDESSLRAAQRLAAGITADYLKSTGILGTNYNKEREALKDPAELRYSNVLDGLITIYDKRAKDFLYKLIKGAEKKGVLFSRKDNSVVRILQSKSNEEPLYLYANNDVRLTLLDLSTIHGRIVKITQDSVHIVENEKDAQPKEINRRSLLEISRIEKRLQFNNEFTQSVYLKDGSIQQGSAFAHDPTGKVVNFTRGNSSQLSIPFDQLDTVLLTKLSKAAEKELESLRSEPRDSDLLLIKAGEGFDQMPVKILRVNDGTLEVSLDIEGEVFTKSVALSKLAGFIFANKNQGKGIAPVLCYLSDDHSTFPVSELLVENDLAMIRTPSGVEFSLPFSSINDCDLTAAHDSASQARRLSETPVFKVIVNPFPPLETVEAAKLDITDVALTRLSRIRRVTNTPESTDVRNLRVGTQMTWVAPEFNGVYAKELILEVSAPAEFGGEQNGTLLRVWGQTSSKAEPSLLSETVLSESNLSTHLKCKLGDSRFVTLEVEELGSAPYGSSVLYRGIFLK